MLPPIKLPQGAKGRLILTRESSFEYAKYSGYAVNGEWVSFVARIDAPGEKLYLSGDFNGWGKAIGQKTWELLPQEMMADERWGILTVKRDLLGECRLFKFVNAEGVWREPSADAPNIAYEGGARNHAIDYRKTGAHSFRWELEGGGNWLTVNELRWVEGEHEELFPIWPGSGFYALESSAPQGALLEDGQTTFRLFAPRAEWVAVVYYRPDLPAPERHEVAMTRQNDGCWSARIAERLEGYNYFYRVDGPTWAHTHFDRSRELLDPWALAVRDGHGVVVDKAKLLKGAPPPFEPPAMEELVLVEAHLQDILAKAPLKLNADERRGYSGLRQLLEWSENPLAMVGANALELQPLAEFDGDGKSYHWGYMPINFFAPASAYAARPAATSQLQEMQQMVRACHEKGISVIVDVVMNHIGVPASPMGIDKAYYFRTNAEGGLTNWSGCGNDFRIESAMAERLALEALEHWVLAYGVDGFRFDLAELLGVDFLKKAEQRLRKIKPRIVMIAEPWSFKGHLGAALKQTSYANWSDGYREFVPAYLHGRTGVEAAKYFVGGSVGGASVRPVQTVNYVESHDDHSWLDKITQNPAKNGYHPTLHDRRLTHLMASLMTMSLGVPMWAAGVETLRSKYGVGNTYLRGDLNAIDYARRRDYPSSSDYFRALGAFRRGPNGRALRVANCPAGYLRYYECAGSSALAVLYNAEGKEDAKRILYLINPLNHPVNMTLAGLDPKLWRQVADHERMDETGLKTHLWPWQGGNMEIPPVSAGIFVEQ
jgi:pullulanase